MWKIQHMGVWARITRTSDVQGEARYQPAYVKSFHFYVSATNSNLRHHVVSQMKGICRPDLLKCHQFEASKFISALPGPSTL